MYITKKVTLEDALCTTPDEAVMIPDPVLLAAIRDELGIPGSQLTCGDMAALDWLVLEEGSGLKSLAGLHNAVNLEVLYVSDTEVSDLTPIRDLASLLYLGVSGSPIADMSVIAGLTGLRTLDIDTIGVTSIEFLRGLTQLESLSLRENPIEDLSPLGDLTQLTTLFIDHVSRTTDISAIAGLLKLERLGIGYLNHEEYGSPDLSHLLGLSNLDQLWSNGLGLSSVAAIGDLNLSFVDVSSNELTEFDELAEMDSLTHLYAHSNQVKALPSDMSGMTSLSLLMIGRNEAISDLGPLAAVPTLEGLSADGTSVSDMSPLAGLDQLRVLILYAAEIESVTAVSESLDILDLGANRITDISGLSGAGNFEVIRLDGNLISDLTPLVANTGLGEDTQILLEENCLDLEAAETQAWIEDLEIRGVRASTTEAPIIRHATTNACDRRRRPGRPRACRSARQPGRDRPPRYAPRH